MRSMVEGPAGSMDAYTPPLSHFGEREGLAREAGGRVREYRTRVGAGRLSTVAPQEESAYRVARTPRIIRFMRPLWPIALVLVCPALPGCETTPDPPMSWETCRSARLCTIRGTLSQQPAGQALMGRLDLPDGRCVAVSLPGEMLARLEVAGPTEVTIRGRVHEVAPDTATMTVEGRTIGVGLCGDFVLFVYDDSEVIPR